MDSDSEDSAPVHPAVSGVEANAAAPPPTTNLSADATAVAAVHNAAVGQTAPLHMNSRNHVMVETDWNVALTAARAGAYTDTLPIISAPFTCFGTSFRLELTPNDRLAGRGVSLRVRSMGPVHRVHLRSALAEIYVKKSATDQVRGLLGGCNPHTPARGCLHNFAKQS